ncbi:MAG: hypothetical protein K9M02_01075 [Thiohalocapsa sp.]|nr:hypothetical protein [Thiohalocapsa sp.]
MTDDSAALFEEALAAALAVYGQPYPGETVLRLWWATLAPYPWAQVRDALQGHVARCKFAPRPADLVERIEAGDGRPAPDEAWSLALRASDEALTVVWTAEIAESWGIARSVLDAGDEVGARKTFLAAYARLTATARANLVPVAWSASLGTDPTLRADALRRAQVQGQLPAARVRALLPASEAGTGRGGSALPIAALLTGTAASTPDARDCSQATRFVAAVREGLRRGVAARAAAERERASARQGCEARLRARRAAVRTELQRRGANGDAGNGADVPDV